MTVYVITSGSYSDYGIRRVFTDRTKAELYVRLNPYIHGDSTEIEEYETDDDKIFEQLRYVDVEFSAYIDGSTGYHCNVVSTTSLDGGLTEQTDFYHDIYTAKERTVLCMVRLVDNDTDEQTLSERYERICEDLFAQIRSLMDTEGWTEAMVDDWLRDRTGERQ